MVKLLVVETSKMKFGDDDDGGSEVAVHTHVGSFGCADTLIVDFEEQELTERSCSRRKYFQMLRGTSEWPQTTCLPDYVSPGLLSIAARALGETRWSYLQAKTSAWPPLSDW